MVTALPARQTRCLNVEQIGFYRREGYLIVEGVFPHPEVAAIRDEFQRVADAGQRIPGHWEPAPAAADDPLQRYPRFMMPHRVNPLIQRYLLDPRVLDILRDLLGEEPLAAQSMYYFKPPGARGQALHQDDYYLRTQNADCIAAWIAIDPSTPENGGLSVVPQTHRLDIQCPTAADQAESFTREFVTAPEGRQPVPALLAPGDVLFFNGRVIHGSTPNRSQTQWRRSLINHYIPASAAGCSHWYFPLLDAQGQTVTRATAAGGGPCGTEKADATYAP